MTSQGTARGRFSRAINGRHLLAAEMAAREMGGLCLADALLLCELLANADPQRYQRAALRWLKRFINERLPPLAEVALAASARAEPLAWSEECRGRGAEAIAAAQLGGRWPAIGAGLETVWISLPRGS
jgi:hypothetical protein